MGPLFVYSAGVCGAACGCAVLLWGAEAVGEEAAGDGAEEAGA